MGRTAWKSTNASGSMSAKRLPSHCCTRYPAATVAAWPPSFQPRNAVTITGLRSAGSSVIRRSAEVMGTA